jgi:hypothetical protein
MAYAQGQPQDNRAIWSLVCGIGGLLCCGLLSIVAIVLGTNVKRDLGDATPSTATVGVILGWIGIALWILGVIAWVVIIAAGSN